MNMNYIPLIVAYSAAGCIRLRSGSHRRMIANGKLEYAVYSPPSVQKASPIKRGDECWQLDTDYEELLWLRQAVLKMELAKSSVGPI